MHPPHPSPPVLAPPSAVATYGVPPGPPGRVRPTAVVVALVVLTLGIYGLYWMYEVHDELRRHTARGLGGQSALVITLFAGPLVTVLTSHEVARLYRARGLAPRVTERSALWVVPGCLLLLGPLVWVARTNAALNDYWSSARGPWGSVRPTTAVH